MVYFSFRKTTLCYIGQNIAGWCQQTFENKCFAFTPQANFPAHNLNFHWRWRWWDRIQAIFLNIFYFKIDYIQPNEPILNLTWIPVSAMLARCSFGRAREPAWRMSGSGWTSVNWRQAASIIPLISWAN